MLKHVKPFRQSLPMDEANARHPGLLHSEEGIGV